MSGMQLIFEVSRPNTSIPFYDSSKNSSDYKSTKDKYKQYYTQTITYSQDNLVETNTQTWTDLEQSQLYHSETIGTPQKDFLDLVKYAIDNNFTIRSIKQGL